MTRHSVAIVGMGNKGGAVYRVLRSMDNVLVVGVADLNLNTPGIILARKDKVSVTDNFEELIQRPEVDTIIDATGSAEVPDIIKSLKRPDTDVMETGQGNLLLAILQAKEELLETKRLKGELWAILNSVQEAIEMADNTGQIKYVNPAFTRATGIPEAQRVGKNISKCHPTELWPIH